MSTESAITAEVRGLLQEKYPNALKLEVSEAGACDAPKLEIVLVDASFEGRKRLDNQREMNGWLREYLDSGRVHAASYKLSGALKE